MAAVIVEPALQLGAEHIDIGDGLVAERHRAGARQQLGQLGVGRSPAGGEADEGGQQEPLADREIPVAALDRRHGRLRPAEAHPGSSLRDLVLPEPEVEPHLPEALADGLVDSQELTHRCSTHLSVPVKTVYRWRPTGAGPRGAKVGRYVRFRRAEVDSWQERQLQEERATGAR